MAAVAYVVSSCGAVQLEREPLLTWKPRAKKDAFNMNYFVPNLGQDQHDVLDTQADISWAESQLGHKLVISDPPEDPPRNYFVPNFGAD